MSGRTSREIGVYGLLISTPCWVSAVKYLVNSIGVIGTICSQQFYKCRAMVWNTLQVSYALCTFSHSSKELYCVDSPRAFVEIVNRADAALSGRSTPCSVRSDIRVRVEVRILDHSDIKR